MKIEDLEGRWSQFTDGAITELELVQILLQHAAEQEQDQPEKHICVSAIAEIAEASGHVKTAIDLIFEEVR